MKIIYILKPKRIVDGKLDKIFFGSHEYASRFGADETKYSLGLGYYFFWGWGVKILRLYLAVDVISTKSRSNEIGY